MAELEPGQRDAGRTRKRWFFLALAVGSALAVLVVGTLFGVIGDGDSVPATVQPVVRSTPHPPVPPAPVVAAPAVSAPPPVRAPPTSSTGQPRQVTTHGPDGSTTTTVVLPDGTVSNTTTTPGASN
jgi:hypothetical protein